MPIGQLASGAAPNNCTTDFDGLNPTVTSGNSYVVPGDGTITSWTHNAGSNPGSQLTMKIFRNVAGLTWLVVGHDGPHGLVPNGTAGNTFATSIAVKRGDVLGMNSANAGGFPNACYFAAGPNPYQYYFGGLADGASGAFTGAAGYRMNVTAAFVPTNTFSLGQTTRNKKKGTATLTVNVPNDGDLTVSGSGAKAKAVATSATSVKAGDAKILIKAKGKKLRRLNQAGKVKLNLAITYMPTGGDPSSRSTKLKLKKL